MGTCFSNRPSTQPLRQRANGKPSTSRLQGSDPRGQWSGVRSGRQSRLPKSAATYCRASKIPYCSHFFDLIRNVRRPRSHSATEVRRGDRIDLRAVEAFKPGNTSCSSMEGSRSRSQYHSPVRDSAINSHKPVMTSLIDPRSAELRIRFGRTDWRIQHEIAV